MHPNRLFHWTDENEMRAFVEARGFAHLFVAGALPTVAHIPLTLSPKGFRFHLSRGNLAFAAIDGATVLASITANDFYVSPDWYVNGANQVPTWNYIAVEIEGVARALNNADLLEQIDALSAAHEANLSPKPKWTSDKVSPDRLRAMLGAIEAFEIEVTAMRGTRKLSQNKSAGDRAGVSAALAALGKHQEAEALV